MGLKENFDQAISELMGGSLRPALSTGTAAYGPQPARSSATFQPRRENAAIHAFSAESFDFTPSAAPVDPTVFRFAEAEGSPRSTIIAEGTVIQGSIRASGGVELYGEVHGDIVAKEGVILAGKLEGNAAGRDIELTGGRVKGNLVSTGRMRVDSGSMVLGNIQAGSLHLNGSVKGDLEVKETVILDVKSAVAGNVTAGKLSIAEGAMLQGEVRISSANLNKLFTENSGANS